MLWCISTTCFMQRSSRSHSVLTVIVDGFNTVTETTSHGCLHLVDLAGSERVGRSEAQGDRLEEAKHINKSLSAIGDVMSALASKAKHVPFRCAFLGPAAHPVYLKNSLLSLFPRQC